jgi:hypothetical protein
MIGVEANHLKMCDLVVKPEPAGWNGWQWFATDNMTESGNNYIDSIVRVQPPNSMY